MISERPIMVVKTVIFGLHCFGMYMVSFIHKFHYIWGYPRVRPLFKSGYLDRGILVAYFGEIMPPLIPGNVVFTDRTIKHFTAIQIIYKWFRVKIFHIHELHRIMINLFHVIMIQLKFSINEVMITEIVFHNSIIFMKIRVRHQNNI